MTACAPPLIKPDGGFPIRLSEFLSRCEILFQMCR